MLVLAVVIGSVVGSFAGVVAHRIPRGESLGGRSRCACGRQLRASENIPFLGYLAARGRAGCCGATIGWWTVGFETVYAATAAAAYAVAGWLGVAAALAALLAVTRTAAAATAEPPDL